VIGTVWATAALVLLLSSAATAKRRRNLIMLGPGHSVAATHMARQLKYH
jgi:hypothetical protein